MNIVAKRIINKGGDLSYLVLFSDLYSIERGGDEI